MPNVDDAAIVEAVVDHLIDAAITELPASRILIGADRDPDDLPESITTLEHWAVVTGVDIEPDTDGGTNDADTNVLVVRVVLFTEGPEGDDQRDHYAVRRDLCRAMKNAAIHISADPMATPPLNEHVISFEKPSRKNLSVEAGARLLVASEITAGGTVVAA